MLPPWNRIGNRLEKGVWRLLTQWQDRMPARFRSRTALRRVPLVPIADQVLLPGAVQRLNVPEQEVKSFLNHLYSRRNPVAIAFSPIFHSPGLAGHPIAVLSHLCRIPTDEPQEEGLAAQGQYRVSIVDYITDTPLAMAVVKPMPETWKGHALSKEEAYVRMTTLLKRWAFLKGSLEPHPFKILYDQPAERLCDLFACYGLSDSEQKREVLELVDGESRFHKVEKILHSEIARLENFPLPLHFRQESKASLH